MRYLTKVDLDSAFWHLKLDDVRHTAWPSPLEAITVVLKSSQWYISEDESASAGQVVWNTLRGRWHSDLWSQNSETTERFDCFLQRCIRNGCKLRRDKLGSCKAALELHGHNLTDMVIKPEKGNISAIVNMPVPADRKGVCCVNGMINYLLPEIGKWMKTTRRLTYQAER